MTSVGGHHRRDFARELNRRGIMSAETVGRLSVEIRSLRPGDAISTSFRSVFDVLESSRRVREHVAGLFPDLFSADTRDFTLDLGPDACSLLISVAVNRAADGAYEIGVNPSERYLELVAAVASHGDAHFELSHGWPILSDGGRMPPVADGEGAGNALPGGQS